jgi:hypothetical protein
MFTLRLDVDSSAAKFLAVIRRSFPTSSSARWSSATVSAVVGRPERRVSLSYAWPPSHPVVREAKQHIVFISSIDTVYVFKLPTNVTDSFSSTRNSISSVEYARYHTSPFWRTPARVRENVLFLSAAVVQ